VIIVDRDTKRVEVFRLGSEGYQAAERPTAGDVLCDVLGVWFRAIGDAEPRLRVGAIGEPDLDAVI
jgi:hypothetical protein